VALGDDARLAQDPQVVGERGLGHGQARLLHHLCAPGLAVARHVPGRGEPVRVGQRGEDARKLEVSRRGLGHVVRHAIEDK